MRTTMLRRAVVAALIAALLGVGDELLRTDYSPVAVADAQCSPSSGGYSCPGASGRPAVDRPTPYVRPAPTCGFWCWMSRIGGLVGIGCAFADCRRGG